MLRPPSPRGPVQDTGPNGGAPSLAPRSGHTHTCNGLTHFWTRTHGGDGVEMHGVGHGLNTRASPPGLRTVLCLKRHPQDRTV